MNRGDVYWVDLEPAFGTEPGKTRPVLIIQTDILNDAGHRSTVILPISTNVKPQPHPYRVHIPKNAGMMERSSDVLIDQITAIDNRRFKERLGGLPKEILAESETKLQHVLDLV
jgi:mRNA interferase MazF